MVYQFLKSQGLNNLAGKPLATMDAVQWVVLFHFSFRLK